MQNVKKQKRREFSSKKPTKRKSDKKIEKTQNKKQKITKKKIEEPNKEVPITASQLIKQNEEDLPKNVKVQETESETTVIAEESSNLSNSSQKEELREDLIQKSPEKSSFSKPRRSRISSSGKKLVIEEMRKSCFNQSQFSRSPNKKSYFLKMKNNQQEEFNVNVESSEKENKEYILSLENKLKEFVNQGEYIKADMVNREIKEAKKRFSEIMIKNLRDEIGKGEKLLNESMKQEEIEIQTKFDELKEKILNDFEIQIENLKNKNEQDKKNLIKNYEETNLEKREREFKKSTKLLEMEENIKGLLKNREYLLAEQLKNEITEQINLEVELFKQKEESKLQNQLKMIDNKYKTEIQSIEQRLNSALNELRIAFVYQKNNLVKRQQSLQNTFKNKELNKLNKISVNKESKKQIQNFRNHMIRKEPFKNSRFRKTSIQKENCLYKE